MTKRTNKRATVTRLDGQPLERGADGLIHGEPLNITDEERARLPKLEAADATLPNIAGVSAADPFRETIEIAHGPNQDGLADQTLAAHTLPTEPTEEG